MVMIHQNLLMLWCFVDGDGARILFDDVGWGRRDTESTSE